MKWLFRKEAAPHAHDVRAGFGQNLVQHFTKTSVKHPSGRQSGSEHAKSGSICGHEWIGHPLESRTNALRSGQITAKTGFYQGNSHRLTHVKRKRYHRETIPIVRNTTVKQPALRPSGSERAKSGSICGREWIGHPLESRTNAVRSGQIAAETGFYQGNLPRQIASNVVEIAVKLRRQTLARSCAMPTRAKSGSILRLSSKPILANKGGMGTICKNQLDIRCLSGIMTHARHVFRARTTMFSVQFGGC